MSMAITAATGQPGLRRPPPALHPARLAYDVTRCGEARTGCNIGGNTDVVPPGTCPDILDSLWDRPSHPEGWYVRSDHVPYARLNIPVVMYSTNLHDDYHTPRDKPER